MTTERMKHKCPTCGRKLKKPVIEGPLEVKMGDTISVLFNYDVDCKTCSAVGYIKKCEQELG